MPSYTVLLTFVIVGLFFVFSSAYDPGPCGCQNGGLCNTTLELCDCQVPHWHTRDCSYLSCTENSKGLDPYSGSCICDDKWEGILCSTCKSNISCAEKYSYLLEKHNGTFVCDKSPYMYNALQPKIYECVVDEIEILKLVGIENITSTIYCLRLNGTMRKPDSECFMQVWTKDGFPPMVSKGYLSEIFFCVFSNCKQELKTGPSGAVLHYDCTNTYCHETGHFPVDVFLINMFRSMIGKAELICDVNTNRCTVKQEEMIFEFLQTCNATECIFIPTNETRPVPPPPIDDHTDYTLYYVVGSILGLTLLFSICLCAIQYVVAEVQNRKFYSHWKELKNEAGADFSFSSIGYSIPTIAFHGIRTKTILKAVSGSVGKGRMLAIMGSSGAGKTTLLDILAGRYKSGTVTGDISVNHRPVEASYQLMKGYVLQDPIIMDTMTVREAVLFSAELRLPSQISITEKYKLVDDVLHELAISHIANTQIGSSLKRGVSGGELRRVAVACELVLSPNILFLDEPTSGLDSYNAHQVMETLSNLAKRGHTIIFSIHQPSSSIFSLFDDLLLLAEGRTAYFGPAQNAVSHFGELGYKVPSDFNPADFLIDVVVKATMRQRNNNDSGRPNEEENELTRIWNACEELPMYSRNNNGVIGSTHLKPKLSVKQQVTQSSSSEQSPLLSHSESDNFSDSLRVLEDGSDSHKTHEQFIETKLTQPITRTTVEHGTGSLIRISTPSTNSALKAAADPLFVTTFQYQFWILSKRALKNFLRNPLLFPLHVLACLILGVAIGYIYWKQPLNFNGTQNRFGCFFFMCLLLAFGAMTSLELFHTERSIFIRERANGYYRPWAYYLSKILFDVIPLRVIPPIFLGATSYFMIGLRPGWDRFLFFITFLILFNVVAGALCLMVGVVVPTVALGNLFTLAINLYFILFGGIMVNFAENRDSSGKKTTNPWTYLRYTSPFQLVMEALLCNELDGRTIQFDPSGVPPPGAPIPGRNILKSFNFFAENIPIDLALLIVMGVSFIVLAGFLLKLCVREKR